MQPWDRREGESDKAYKAFSAYLELGDRSLRNLAEKWGKSGSYVGQLERWSAAHDWVARASAWDDHLAAESRKKAEQDIIEKRATLKKREWEASEGLLDNAFEILRLPTTQRIVNDGEGRLITIEPINFSARDAARFLEAGSKLGRLSTDMKTDNQGRELTGKDGEPLGAGVPLDLSGLDDDELILFHSLLRKAAAHQSGEREPEPEGEPS